MKNKKIEFDPSGKCPICGRTFRSYLCPHTFWYVHAVVDEANRSEDVQRTILRIRRKDR